MATTLTVFIILWLAFILPLVFFNLEKLKIKKEGEKSKLNISALAILITSSVIISFLLYKTYTITIDYQPTLVTDRVINALSTSDFNMAKDNFNKLSKENLDDSEIKALHQVISFSKDGRYQLGKVIKAKYFFDKEFFPSQNVSEIDNDVVCVMVRIDNGKGAYNHFIIRLRKVDEIKWRVDATMEASEEAVTYAEKYDLINKEHAGTWYKL